MIRSIIYIGVLLGAAGCGHNTSALRSGDLLFMAGKSSDMTGAITASTGADTTLVYSHVGIFYGTGGADSVLEASTEGGTCMVHLREFLNRAAKIDGRPAVVAMRLRDTTGTAVALSRARIFIGQHYDYSFRPDNGRLYCSELVWESYLATDGTHRFQAQPMNFRAADGTMPVYWVELFAQRSEPIPQGIPGTNPNDMAQDRQLEEIHRWY